MQKTGGEQESSEGPQYRAEGVFCNISHMSFVYLVVYIQTVTETEFVNQEKRITA